MDEYGEKTSDPVVISTYKQDSFEDLCRGPHVQNTKEINPDAISITFKAPAGAYWRGDEHNAMLTRIYGTAWETAAQLEEYLHLLEEARKRDHRQIGQRLGLFTFNPLVGKGLPLWKPKGAILRETLERFCAKCRSSAAISPSSHRISGAWTLYDTSGHYPTTRTASIQPD